MTSSCSRVLPSLALATLIISGCSSGRSSTDNSPPPSKGPDITAEDIERAPGRTIEDHLKGRVAGVTVARTSDGGISVRIRGATSFYGNNEPLYVVDGVPITPGPGGSLTGIDPYDIESISVLKDPADTALYGMRGANGVIVIKTKRTAKKISPG